jgi:hypothetical protein
MHQGVEEEVEARKRRRKSPVSNPRNNSPRRNLLRLLCSLFLSSSNTIAETVINKL